jgi:hypothetical protein
MLNGCTWWMCSVMTSGRWLPWTWQTAGVVTCDASLTW